MPHILTIKAASVTKYYWFSELPVNIPWLGVLSRSCYEN